MTAPRHRIRRLVLAVLALIVLGEAAARLVSLFEGPTGALYSYVVPTGKRFKMRPSTRVVVPERYGDIAYRFNRQGYRDRDHDPSTPGRRLVWLGDSVSFGLGVAQERTFVGLLQQDLATRRQRPSEIVNLAIFAYDTRNELDALREDGLAYRPELVVLQFYANDFGTPPAGAPVPAPPKLADRLTALKNRLVYRSALYLRLHQAVDRLGYLFFHDRRRRHPETLNADEVRGDREMLLAHPDDRSIAAFSALGEVRDTAAANGARLFVFYSPDEVQLFTDRYDVIDQRLARFCAGAGIPFYDPLPALRADSQRAALFYDGVHYSPAGHRRMAELLAAEMARRGLLAE